MQYFTPELFITMNRMNPAVNPVSDKLFSDALHAYNEVENRITENSSLRTRRVIRKLRTWHDDEIKAISLRQTESFKPVMELTVVDENDKAWLLTMKAVEACSVNVPTAEDWFTLSWGWCEFDEIEVDGKKKLKLSVLCTNLRTEIEAVFSSIWLSKAD